MRNRVTCPECRKVITWPIDNPAGPFCPECGGLIGVVDNKPTERAPILPTEENLGFKYEIEPEEVDINAPETELASSFALWFAQDVYGWHPEEIAEAALRFGIASGELRVVKKVRFANGQCEECGIMEQVMVDCVLPNNCPGCGAEIVKE